MESRNKEKETPLHKAARYNRPQTIQLLLDNGAMVDSKGGFQNGTPLHHLARNKTPVGMAAALLLAKGAALHAVDNHGDTPLHIAASFDRPGAVQILLDFGADPRIQNKRKKKPRDGARRRYKYMIIPMLDAAEAELDKKQPKD